MQDRKNGKVLQIDLWSLQPVTKATLSGRCDKLSGIPFPMQKPHHRCSLQTYVWRMLNYRLIVVAFRFAWTLERSINFIMQCCVR
uniref:Protein kinase domain-containing protein n=1 Tax=Bursaphelenchus xylophilus TaxID=6326 RepID=A0A1I7RLY0_BURXY